MRRAAPKYVLLLAAFVLAGCGSTARDEFIYNRQVVIKPQRGDGSRIASQWNAPKASRPVARATPIAAVGE